MADVFGYKRSPKASGVFSSEGSLLTVGSITQGARTAYLIQNWTVQYAQDVHELFEIGSDRIFWVKGRPIGRGSIGRIVGGVGGSDSLFPDDAYDICEGGSSMTIEAAGGHCKTGKESIRMDKGVKLEMDGVAVSSIAYSMNVADVRLVEDYTWRFAHLVRR